jgi:outer membrane receptor protein involved in Fe transport
MRSLESAGRTAAGAFVEADVPLPFRLALISGVRGEGIRVRNAGGFFGDRSHNLGAIAASGAVTWTPTPAWRVVAQIARGFRDPTVSDRFSRGPVGRGFFEGNPDLEPETSRQFDITSRYSRGRLVVDAAAYRYMLSNLVERYTAAADLFRLRNRSRARYAGVELTTRADVGGGLEIDLTAQTSRGRDVSDESPLNDVEPSSLAVMGRYAWRERVHSYVRVAGVAAHDEPGPGEVRTPGYTLVDAGASVTLSSRLQLRATLRNALNQRYFSSAGPRWVLAPGRQVAVTVVATSR